MKTLLLFRHAKSSWDEAALSDHDRPLAPRGRRAAPAMAAHLRSLDVLPDLVVSSTAVRTRQTVERALEHLDTPETEFDSSLYLAAPDEMLAVVRDTEDAVETLMLVAHNPGMHELALELCGAGAERDLDRLDRKFPTAAVAVIDLDVTSWRQVEPGIGRLRTFLRPKDLAGAEGEGFDHGGDSRRDTEGEARR